MFKNQAKKLIINTNHLRPNINNEYSSTNTFRTNQYGYVQGETDNNYDNLYPKIIFMGGSTTENNEVLSENRFPLLVKRALSKELNRNFYIVNAGVRGNTSLSSINLIINHPSYQKFDYYILMHNFNDREFLKAFPKYIFQSFTRDRYSFKTIISDVYIDIKKLFDLMVYKSNILFLLKSSLYKFHPWGEALDDHHVDQKSLMNLKIYNLETKIELAFKENINIFLSIIHAKNAKAILMTQPYGKLDDQQRLFNKIIKEVSVERSIPLIDLEKSMSENPKYFLSDYLHFNEMGSKKASELISKFLSKILSNKNNLKE